MPHPQAAPARLRGASGLKRLRRLNLKPVVTATSFGVTGMPGPLVDGELDRARTWGADLAAHLP